MSDRLIVYGTGSVARRFVGSRHTTVDGLRFATTDGGGEFCGQPVLSAAEAAQDKDAAIVIASSFVGPIIETLRRLGVEPERISWYTPTLDRLAPVAEIDGTVRPHDCLYAIYDLEANTPDYDAVVFAARAELERRRRGLTHLHFVVPPARLKGPDPDLLPGVFGLIEDTAGLSRLASREEIGRYLAAGVALFPSDYEALAPRDEQRLSLCHGGPDPRVLTAPARAHDDVRRALAGKADERKLVTLTIGSFPTQPDRMPHLAAWCAVLRALTETYRVIVVRDRLDAIDSEFAEFDHLSSADFDLGIRLALYESAHLNLVVQCGPANLLYFSARSRYLAFNVHAPARFDRDKDPLTTRWGLRIGAELSFAGPLQRLVWRRDDLACLTEEISRMLDRIDPGAVPHALSPIRLEPRPDFVADDGSLAFVSAQAIFDPVQDHVAPQDWAEVPWVDLFSDDRCGIFFAIGQSNAANAGAIRHRSRRPVYSWNFLDMRCHPAADPLPGSGGFGGSVWSRLGDRLIEEGLFDRVLFVPVALGGTHIVEWLPGGPCYRRVALALARLRRALGRPDLRFTAALWAQGETDGNATQMPAETYRAYLNDVIAGLRQEGVSAPVFVARSTRATASPGTERNCSAIRAGQAAVVDEAAGIFAGPDTDALIGEDRFEGYHFSVTGLEKCADLWLACLRSAGIF